MNNWAIQKIKFSHMLEAWNNQRDHLGGRKGGLKELREEQKSPGGLIGGGENQRMWPGVILEITGRKRPKVVEYWFAICASVQVGAD